MVSGGLPAAAVVLACLGLAGVWLGHPHYGYGWCVPLLAAFFAHERAKGLVAGRSAGRSAAVALLCAAVAFVPVRVVVAANPDWRMAHAAAMGLALVFCLALAWYTGGRAWVRGFLFPCVFLLSALPWPTAWEREIIGSLTNFNAAAGAELLAWVGAWVEREGNVIRTAAGAVGVDEACGGLGGMQAGVMLALAAGEIVRAGIGGRLALLALALPVAVGVNLARTLVLVSALPRWGEAGVAEQHDVVGTVFLVLQIVLVAALARAVRGGVRPRAAAAAPGQPLPAPLALGCWAAFAVALVAPPVWFHIRSGGLEDPGWAFAPKPGEGWKRQALPAATRAVLGADREFCYTGTGAGAGRWAVFCIEWKPENIRAIPARAHSPEVCLTGRAGLSLERDLGVVTMEVGGLNLAFRHFVFGDASQAWTVFFGAFSGREPGGGVPDARRRLRWAWEGRRNDGYRTIEFALSGRADAAEAGAAFGPILRRLVSGTGSD